MAKKSFILKSVIFSLIVLFMMVLNVQAATGSTTTVTNELDAASSVYISSFDLDPQVFYPYETGTVTVHVTNPSNTSIGLSQPDLIDPHVHMINRDSFSTMTTAGPGATVDYPFIVTVDPPDGTDFPLFTVSTNAAGGSPIHAQIPIKVDSTDIRAIVVTKPDNFAISKKDTVNVSIINPRGGDITNVQVIPEGNGVDVSPAEYYVGTLNAKSAVQVPFQLTPNQQSPNLTFHVRFNNGDNKHTKDVILPLNIGEDKTAAAPVVNNIAITNLGSSYQMTGDVNNAGITDAHSLILTVGEPAKAVEPYAAYSVGSLASDDFSSFELTFTASDLSSLPVVIQWKDADGNSFSTTQNLNLRSITGGNSTSRTGSSGISSGTLGTTGARTALGYGGPGGGGGAIFGFGGNSRSGGLSAFYPVIAGGILVIIAIVLWLKRKWIAAKLKKLKT
jgi:hypothetical protein